MGCEGGREGGCCGVWGCEGGGRVVGCGMPVLVWMKLAVFV